MAEFTLDEVAARLHISRRTLQRRMKETGLAFIRPGRSSYLFTERDFQILCEAIRQCRSGSSHQDNERAITGTLSAARSTAETSRSLRRRATARLLNNLERTSSESSSRVVALDLERR